ncbi:MULTISPECIES: DUF2750 domain-containing protein [unclassified Thalassotalea]|uniref:DUF2750 domain-containing protein n=1 Tax=unclassified Thalassotalea TaxID=2614972 RepID=UPI00107FF06B|nr:MULTISPECIES: DUF2750 domain-containing protein [unclassified Thalassotalea]NMP15426.1 DUF2750 domain-containing protein [Thalassotalea sp. Y01]QBY05926.1 DUF2750 domain-containing protein [Thalassotalea sp. HSM 43]
MVTIDKNSLHLTDTQRYELFIQQLMSQREAWILTDEHGAVMLTENEEDFVPFWPNEETAACWATDEWDHCKPVKLTLDEIRERWLPGMEEDDLCLIIFPNQNLTGQIFYPWQFADIIDKKLAKLARKN